MTLLQIRPSYMDPAIKSLRDQIKVGIETTYDDGTLGAIIEVVDSTFNDWLECYPDLTCNKYYFKIKDVEFYVDSNYSSPQRNWLQNHLKSEWVGKVIGPFTDRRSCSTHIEKVSGFTTKRVTWETLDITLLDADE